MGAGFQGESTKNRRLEILVLPPWFPGWKERLEFESPMAINVINQAQVAKSS